MDLTSEKQNPEDASIDVGEIRELAKWLYPGEFRTNRRAAILRSVLWLNAAAADEGDTSGGIRSPATAPARHVLVEELARYIDAHGLSYEVIAEKIGVGAASIAQWLRGIVPKASSLEKIRSFLEGTEEIATDVAKESAVSADLFATQEPVTHPPAESA
jgi:hypothetical protein